MRALWFVLPLALLLFAITGCDSGVDNKPAVVEEPTGVTDPETDDPGDSVDPSSCLERCGIQDAEAPCQCDPGCLEREDCCKGICGVCGDVPDLAPVCAPCAPQCDGKECGDDGCGGACGTCEEGFTCDDTGLCAVACQPQCDGKECGADGCGGSCGGCEDGKVCGSGLCVDPCEPDCDAKACGDDGCGGTCGACEEGSSCDDTGQCVLDCVPDCEGKDCGTDGCSGTCGTCPLTAFCTAVGVCESFCEPSCEGKVCGDDGCGGFCGEECADGLACVAGACVDEAICCEVQECPDGFACDPGTCGCDLPCCTEDFCNQTGESCDKTSCECVEKVCCTPETCAESGLVCNTDTCDCQVDTLGQTCAAFVEDGGCMPGQWCEPIGLDGFGGMLGLCQAIEGELGEGGMCGGSMGGMMGGMGGMGGMMGACGAGLACVNTESGMGECMTYCQPGAEVGAPGGCDFGEGCVVFPLTDASGGLAGVPDYGFCRPSCTPFVPQEDSGCPNIEWCFPNYFSAQTGDCEDGTGAAAEGDTCGSNTGDPATTCGPGLLCVNSGAETTCSALCDPAAQEGGPGDTCSEGSGCGGLSLTNADGSATSLAIGSCVPSCGFHEDIPCEDETLSCSPGEIFGMSDDRCITPNTQFSEWPMPEFAVCPGVAEGVLCGPNQACFDIPPEMEPAELSGTGIRCHDLCVLSEGPSMLPGHPDCRRDTALCLDVLGGIIGLCGPDAGLTP